MGRTAEPSILSSQGSYPATDLSRKTENTSYSIPEDGHPVTIQTNPRKKKKDPDTSSTVTHGTNASLLIEYFDKVGASGRRPSVRVKVTPGAAKRHQVKAAPDGLQISDVGSRPSSRQDRRPSYSHRVSLNPHVGEDRMILGEPHHTRSLSGDQSTLSSYASGADDSNLSHYPLSVTVIRDAGSPRSTYSSPRDVEETEFAFRTRRRKNQSTTRDYPGGAYQKDPFKASQNGVRSRSVSRETNVAEEAGLRTPKLGRRRSRSLSRERVSMSREEKRMIEQNVMEGLEKLRLPKQRKPRSRSASGGNGDLLKAPRMRSRSRSRDQNVDEITAEKMRQKRKEAHYDERKRAASTVTNPALLELVEDAIKRMILPQLNELKSAHNQAKFEQTLSPASILDRQASNKRPGKSLSMPDVGKPMVVLSPDADKGNGQGVVISGGAEGDPQEVISQFIDKILVIAGGNADVLPEKSEASFSRAPGFGVSQSSIHSADGEGVSLVGAVPANGNGGRVNMPDAPDRLDTPGTYDGTRASILTARSGLPYPKENGMPPTGNTPPPASKPEFPVFSELNLHSGASSALSERTGFDDHRSVASKRSLDRNGAGGPSIVSFAPVGDEDGDGVSSVSSGSRRSTGAPTTLAPGGTAVSIMSMSSTQSTKLAKQRRKGKGKGGDMSDINEADYDEAPGSKNAVDMYFAKVREEAQEKALRDPGLVDTSIEARHVSTVTNNDFDDHLERFDGQQVFSLGANPSMRSTPVVANSVQPSVLEAPTNLDGMSNISYSNSPLRLGASALPKFDDPMPEYGHIADDDDEEEDINTNPSIIQGPSHEPDDWQFNPPAQSTNELRLGGERGLDGGLSSSHQVGQQAMSPTPPALKDEGYISAANPGMASPSPMTPVQGMGDPSMGMGTIRGIGLEDESYSPYRGHARMGSGNSHGMPSPLYDSSTGRGIDRIQSRDIVALMDHLTVRDAQRNARDTEILVALVRSAAEARNSFEDLKKALEQQQHVIIDGVDQNTERSVQKIIQGPRPLPPSLPRPPRYNKPEEDAEDEGPAKRRNVFRRALKGLSMRSSNDLQRIEEMLQTLLLEVEGLKSGREFYQQSMLQSQSIGTFDVMKSPTDGQDTNPANSSGANSGYGSGGPSKQPSSSRIYQDERPRQSTRVSPIEEDTALRTPPRSRGGELPLETPPDRRVPPAALSNDHTPTKSEKHQKRESNSSSYFPKLSRWSETTNSSTGVRGIFSRRQPGPTSDGSRSDSNFWEPPVPKDTQQGSPYTDGQPAERPHSPLVPPSSRDTDAPITHANRRSLEVQHPQPRIPCNHQLEAQAQQLLANGVTPGSPGMNASTSSLGTLPPLGPGGYSNGKLMSPLAQDAFNQHRQQKQQQPPNGPPIPPKVKEDPMTPAPSADDPSSINSRSGRGKKHRERDENGKKPKRTDEEKAARREKKERRAREREAAGLDSLSSTPRKKPRDLLSPEGREGDVGSPASVRSPSTASRLNGPRPLSSNSNKENSRRHRHHGSQATVGTFGNPEYEPFTPSYR